MDKYTLIRKLEGHHNDVVSCEFSPDGALLATASYDTRVILWDHQRGSILLELGYDALKAGPFAATSGLDSVKLMLRSSLPGISSLHHLPFLPEEQTTAGSDR